jgi:two-component system response regulator MprA
MSRVLLVEDDPLITEMIADELLQRGYHVETAANGADALERVAAQRPDAIVLDLMLPILHGWDFVDHYREHTSGELVPIVVVSAAGAVTRSMERMGVKAFLPKPLNLEELVQRLTEITGEPAQ